MKVIINGKPHTFPADTTILNACTSAGVYVPTLCYHEDLPSSGKCGLCVVRVNGNSFAYSCIQKVANDMIIDTNCPDVIAKSRRAFNNFIDMSVLPPSKDIEEISKYLFPKNAVRYRESDRSNALDFNPNLCINCGRCIRMCSDIQNIGALNYVNPRIRNNECISCGQCVMVCPTEALMENNSKSAFLRAVAERKTLVLQIAPSSRVAVGEGFNMPVGAIVTGKLIRAAREIGFHYVFDTNFGADITIIEEANELLDRINESANGNKNVSLPMFTGCCPAWVNYVERLHNELIPNLTTTKSPHMIVGRLIKTYFAQKVLNVDPKNVVLVSLMPCVGKKDEIKRMQMIGDVDIVLTTREFINLIKDYGIDFQLLKESEFDQLLGVSSGAGQIFGSSGGVAESCVRYLHKKLLNQPLGKIEYTQFRGMDSIKQTVITLGDKKLNIAVCNGIGPASEFIENEKYKTFHFIEVMACPGGCIGGAGQPKINRNLVQDRMKSIFQIDRNLKYKVSDDNPNVIEIYKSFLGQPLSPKCIELLHTHYEPQETAVLAQKKRMMSMPIVGYGSASGTAMRLGRIVAGFIGTTSTAINSLTVKQMIARKIAIFIISTTGDGEYPTNSRKFIEELRNSMEELSMVQFAVLGLGNQSYKYYCRAGKQLNMLLEQHLAKPILPLAEIDTSLEDKGEASFERWCHQLSSALNLKPPKIGIHLNYTLIPEDDDTIVANPLRPVGFEIATLKSNTLITPPKSEIEKLCSNSVKDIIDDYVKQLNLYTIKLPNGMSYSVGEMVEVLPENPEELTNAVIDALKLSPNQVFKLISNDSTIETYVPEKVSVRQLFSQYMDLNGPPSRSILRAFLEVANREGCDRLERLLDVKDKEAIETYMKDINTAEFICEFVKYGTPSLDLILSSCPHIKPRSYLVASSPLRSRNTVDLLVYKHRFCANNKRNGLCSTFLDNPNLRKIPIRVVSGTFEMPEDRSTPIIMTAIGCGIAPFLAMMQNRSAHDGPALLVFGSTFEMANKKVVEIIEEEKSNGTITDVLYAWSKKDNNNGNIDGGGKTIQDVMNENMKLLWKYWSDERAVLYYCGVPGHNPDILKEVMLKVTIQEGGLSSEESNVYNNGHPIYVEAF